MLKPIATLSLDLDNQWSYMKTGAIAGWEHFPSYFEVAVPRLLEAFDRHGLAITVFVVGQDAALSSNRDALASIADAGHEIANHSFFHEPWLNRKPANEIADELRRAHEAIAAATGQSPVGFRGPGFALSTGILETLVSMGYQYDASTFPTFLGPLARAYYFMRSGFSKGEQDTRAHLFGSMADGLRPLKPYRWATAAGPITELPVTTWPLLRAPIHFTYLSFLAAFSPALALAYFKTAVRACRLAGVAPSFLLHPLDVLDGGEIAPLARFPGMGTSSATKRALLDRVLADLAANFTVLPMGAHAAQLKSLDLPVRVPNFAVDQHQTLVAAEEMA